MWKLGLILTLMLAAPAGEALAQSRMADGAITVERALTISTVRPLSFGRTSADGVPLPSGVTTDAVIQITGDPGRVYRVRLPVAITTSTPDATIDSFTIRSDNSGDISETLTARMDQTGQDRLHIGGSLRQSSAIVITDVIAAIPLSVDYE
jgi:Domain of unknown function (DUF4402)